MGWTPERAGDPERLLETEWLVTNGLGGYASGSVAGAVTRRFHGLLIAALPAPQGRTVLLNHLAEEVRMPGGALIRLGAEEPTGGPPEVHAAPILAEFRLELGLPVWRFDLGGVLLEKRLVLPRGQNTVYVRYRLDRGNERIRLRLRPSLQFRPHGGRVDRPFDSPYTVTNVGSRYEVRGDGSGVLRLRAEGESASFVLDGGRFRDLHYRIEAARGYDADGRLWSPGYLRAELYPHREVTVIASAEPWETVEALSAAEAFGRELERRGRLLERAHPAAREGFAAELVLAADPFLVTPNTREADLARAQARGDDAETVIAGYPWFTDWGRDTMISLEGLALLTGRAREAGAILRTFAGHVRDGLIPNHFPEGRTEAVYNTADATLWYFHALHAYVEATRDRGTLRDLLPALRGMIEAHWKSTAFGIGIDPADGLLRQGTPDLPLTWMDARVGDWVVTPRRGKPVEINALWYHALRLMQEWVGEEEGQPAGRPYAEAAERVRESFNRRFWNASRGYLYDVIDGEAGDDPSLRPNQIFAVSLPHAVLDPSRWEPVVETVRRHLLTPVGLRTLAPGEPEYRAKYDGDLRARDAAYHQGTVWPWLLGPFVDAWLKIHPGELAGARGFLDGLERHLGEAGVGTIGEVFDAEPPFAPRGCVAQAWSVAEALRAWIRTQAHVREPVPAGPRDTGATPR